MSGVGVKLGRGRRPLQLGSNNTRLAWDRGAVGCHTRAEAEATIEVYEIRLRDGLRARAIVKAL